VAFPTSPELTERIPRQTFELVRDRIAQILALELGGQAALQPPDEQLQGITVFTDRFIPLDVTDLPAVDVLFSSATYDTDGRIRVDGPGVFVINVFTAQEAQIDASGNVLARGDTLSVNQNSRILGVIRSILQSAPYKTLAFDPKLLPIGGRKVDRIMSVDPSAVDENVANLSKGMAQFTVKFCEVQELDKVRDLEELVSEGRVDGGERGIVWKFEITP
jgi:hypothetical protein